MTGVARVLCRQHIFHYPDFGLAGVGKIFAGQANPAVFIFYLAREIQADKFFYGADRSMGVVGGAEMHRDNRPGLEMIYNRQHLLHRQGVIPSYRDYQQIHLTDLGSLLLG